MSSETRFRILFQHQKSERKPSDDSFSVYLWEKLDNLQHQSREQLNHDKWDTQKNTPRAYFDSSIRSITLDARRSRVHTVSG